MGEQTTSATRMGPFRRGGANRKGGEIVEVEGGHIVRSTGRKDRHSKVCTAKGPRDRRVRLSAHTGIQFYDVQDRLGYDRPSKAVDWLIKKAKPAIDELAQLPAWQPTAEPRHRRPKSEATTDPDSSSSLRKQPVQLASAESPPSASFENLNPVSSFLPPTLYSDAISDTIKSFFPPSSFTASSSSSSFANFHNYNEPPPSSTRELRLSLQSFQDQQNGQNQHHSALPKFSGEDAGGGLPQEMFLAQDWEQLQQQQQAEMGRLQRLVSWNATPADGLGGGGFLSPLPPQFLPPISMPVGHAAGLFIQRGPLQSSHSPSVRARIFPETQVSLPVGFDGRGGAGGRLQQIVLCCLCFSLAIFFSMVTYAYQSAEKIWGWRKET